MIGRLNHVAIAVKDLAASTALYRDTLGARVSQPLPQPEHGVTVVFVELPNTKIELLEPLGADSPIAKFLERNADFQTETGLDPELFRAEGGAVPLNVRSKGRIGTLIVSGLDGWEDHALAVAGMEKWLGKA